MKVNFPLYPRLMEKNIFQPNERPTPAQRRPVLTHPYANAMEGSQILEAFKTAIDILNHRDPAKLCCNPSDPLYVHEAKRIALMGLSAKFKYISARSNQKEALKLHEIYNDYLNKYPDPVEGWGFKIFVEMADPIKIEIKESHTGRSYNVMEGFLPADCSIAFIRPALAKRDAIINFIYNFCVKLDIYEFGIQKTRQFIFPLILSLAKHNRFSHPLPSYLIDELLVSPRTKLPFNIPSF